jgi:2-methylisocitrate lyase-like PEP mutase family enzyme
MNQKEKARRFADLHVKGEPVLLYNAWDAGSAKAIVEAGAEAVATSSWAVAEAHGYRDGESIPEDFAERIVARIAATVAVPVTVDFEGGYSDDDAVLAENVSRLLDAGIVGINVEDRVVKGEGLYPTDRQTRRIAAIRAAAERKGVPLFINARTDLFFQDGDPAQYVAEALERARAYAAAGASGFFVPCLTDDAQIRRVIGGVSLPVNVMQTDGLPANERLAQLDVARISYGPIPYIAAMDALEGEAAKRSSPNHHERALVRIN